MKIGVAVVCAACGRRKAPRGRSVPHELANSMCQDYACDGYHDTPYSGCLWPGETEEEFGYPIGPDGWKESPMPTNDPYADTFPQHMADAMVHFSDASLADPKVFPPMMDEDMQAEYDFTGGIRGKHRGR